MGRSTRTTDPNAPPTGDADGAAPDPAEDTGDTTSDAMAAALSAAQFELDEAHGTLERERGERALIEAQRRELQLQVDDLTSQVTEAKRRLQQERAAREADRLEAERSRAVGAVRTVMDSSAPLFVDALRVSVRRGERVEHIDGGRLVDETDLDDDEIDELAARRIVRLAKPDEIAAADKRRATSRVTE